ncbi:DMSO/selenate family reductase complex B subunit [Bacteroidota bacterium]
MKKQYGFYFDANSCSGCKACQVACKDKNDLPVGILWRRVYDLTGGNWEKKGEAWISKVVSYNLSMSCNHCEDPICVTNCPTTALFKREDGIVLIDESKCIGCKYCEWTCPYGAPQYDSENGVMTKCDFCYDYIEEGKNPSCVDACPMRALEFGELKVLQKKYGNQNQINPLPSGSMTKPAIVISPHEKSGSIGPLKVVVSNREEV